MSLLSSGRRQRSSQAKARGWLVVVALAFMLTVVASSQAGHLFSDVAGHTTLERIVTGDNPDNGYAELRSEAVNGSYLVRDGTSEGNAAIPTARSGRDGRRTSLAYFGQLTDFQLADEETPAKVEFADPGASSAWRPQEALQPFIIDWSIRQMNLFTGASPVTQGDGSRAAMDFALVTGDQADSQQRNETIWVRELIEGGRPLNFNSGSTDPADYDPTEHPSCANFPPSRAHRDEALRYTGVQDYDDYDEGPNPQYYDPDDVRASWATAGWPTYTGLMDRAQQLTITPAGLDVPSYVTNGNHDTLVQGNEDAIEPFEAIATGCLKALGSTQNPRPPGTPPDPSLLLTPSSFMLVPPDPLRRYVSKPQVKAVYRGGGQDNAHGFDFVDPAEVAASNDSASYYAWDPPEAPGFRFISLDTVAEGGVVEQTSSGNIDDPQFQWLKGELDQATEDGKLIVVWGHHPVRSLTADVSDEAASPCTTQHNHGDVPEHDRNPGCDLDPRDSEPLHLGRDPVAGDPRESLVELLDGYPHVISYVAGHTHDNNIEAFPRSGGGVWWGIETSATADWPVQHRLIEVMDNNDGTLSIFGTLLDHAAAAAAPAPGSATGFDSAQLASLGREFAFNDPQAGDGTGEGAVNDQNVELLVDDPRIHDHPQEASPLTASLVPAFRETIGSTQCSARGGTNSSHGAPLAFSSCNPPAYLPGTAAKLGPQSVGSAGLTVMPGDLNTPADEADVALAMNATDVQDRATPGGDYAPNPSGNDITMVEKFRLSDTLNGPSLSDSATVIDFDFPVGGECVGTASPTTGSACNVSTTADAVMPGSIKEGKHMVVQVFRVRVNDSGNNGTRGDSDDRMFAQQGIYIP